MPVQKGPPLIGKGFKPKPMKMTKPGSPGGMRKALPTTKPAMKKPGKPRPRY